MVVTNLGANAVHRFVPRPGVVHRNPRRRLQSGPQNLPRLADEPLLTRGQEPHHLAFGDRHPEVVKQTNQTLHGGLAPVILGQHETAKLGPEVPGDAWWQRRHHGRPLGRHPALPAIAYGVWPDHQILHHVVLVALEPGTTGNLLGLDHARLVDAQAGVLLATPRLFAPRLDLAPPVRLLRHPARLDNRPTLETLQTRYLVAQGGVLSLQRKTLLKQLQHQLLEVIQAQSLNIW